MDLYLESETRGFPCSISLQNGMENQTLRTPGSSNYKPNRNINPKMFNRAETTNFRMVSSATNRLAIVGPENILTIGTFNFISFIRFLINHSISYYPLYVKFHIYFQSVEILLLGNLTA